MTTHVIEFEVVGGIQDGTTFTASMPCPTKTVEELFEKIGEELIIAGILCKIVAKDAPNKRLKVSTKTP